MDFSYGRPLLAVALLCATGAQNLHAAGAAPASPAKVAEARGALEDNLLNYSSTRLRQVRLVKTSGGFEAFCGEINTTNRFGGYLGWKKFLIPLGKTTIGDLLDKVTIEGQASSAASFLAEFGARPNADANARHIAHYCGEGSAVDQTDYTTALTRDLTK
jgi:hypothetical protein